MSDHVTLFEVGPRDGLQNERVMIRADQKIALIDALSQCGVSRLEATSFVSPRAIPQLADAGDVMAGITRAPGVRYAVLTPNLRGFEAARAAGADEVAVFASASEGFSQANLNCSVAESFARFAPVLEAAEDAKIPVRGYVSCVTDCPFDGSTPPSAVARIATKLMTMGCFEISLGDTIGKGRPDTVYSMLAAVMTELPASVLAGHFHDTGGKAIRNIAVCLDAGVRVFDTAVAGLGGCPYAPGAPGNADTRVVMEWLEEHGVQTGLDADALGHAEAIAKAVRQGAAV
ncbi:hydroxymethylglutaryl-CoA lyase [Meridianimarinicoccus aquatilis]|uniref:Hydroxymethylglutaryl-CoA lyase n=1 Tax=Meridianimarinicoccus aquatilis TaxID=2552766 RepID=A0A4R6AZA8_9RHOB|nr:hydroxymethylglutaryl-CoA lyase [Fluviibacterium aquatile]QIE43045.1 hydroxymethylglutaryl-CoA lyase [Rhodobacteraceae bacterium SC52]TDL87766.1 hydroxymethylglutaryl-CoA lyase [Fluviibacterium aquatile]